MSESERKTFHHLVVQDLEKIGSRKVVVKEEILSMFRIIMEEGLKDICTGKISLHLSEPMTLGVIMCTTPEDLGDRRSVFRTLSFQSRVLPFTYDYSPQLKTKVLSFIESEEHNTQKRYKLAAHEKVKVILPTKYARRVTPYAIALSKTQEKFSRKSPIDNAEKKNRLVGIRAKENLMTLLRAIALCNDRTIVKGCDFDEFLGLYRHVNYRFRIIDNARREE